MAGWADGVWGREKGRRGSERQARIQVNKREREREAKENGEVWQGYEVQQ